MLAEKAPEKAFYSRLVEHPIIRAHAKEHEPPSPAENVWILKEHEGNNTTYTYIPP